MADLSLDSLLAQLPADALVLDVGGWAGPHPRSDWVIDIGSYATRNYYASRFGSEGPAGEERFTRQTWIEHDICAPGPWPVDDRTFDFAICTQTLEDVRDPVKVCAEMSRVARAGYVATPAAAVELTRGIESPFWCGWHHHRWLIEVEDGGLVFILKPHHIHSPLWPAIRSPKLLYADEAVEVALAWSETLRAREEVLVDQDDLDSRLARIVARASRPDPLGKARRRAAQSSWSAYARARASLRRAVRGGSDSG